MVAIIRCEDVLSEFAEREKKRKKESANSLGKKRVNEFTEGILARVKSPLFGGLSVFQPIDAQWSLKSSMIFRFAFFQNYGCKIQNSV